MEATSSLIPKMMDFQLSDKAQKACKFGNNNCYKRQMNSTQISY